MLSPSMRFANQNPLFYTLCLVHLTYLKYRSVTLTLCLTPNSINIMFLDIILRPVFIQKRRPVYFSKNNVSETGFHPCLQVKPTHLGPIDRASPHLQTPVPTQHVVYKPSTA
jgi:hypothetical protein